MASALAVTTLLGALPQSAAAQDGFLGEMRLFGFNFCPRSHLPANGALLSISQNSALYSLYGTTYGGDGRTTFALPDLRGRSPVGHGQGPGLNPVQIGVSGGAETTTLTAAQLPAHSHGIQAVDSNATALLPTDGFPAIGLTVSEPDLSLYHSGPPTVTMNSAMVTETGGNQPVPIRSPYLGMTWCVTSDGIYPSRS